MDTRNRSMIFKGLVVNIEQMDVGVGSKGWHTFQVLRHPGGVGVLPMHDDGTITLIRQFRPSVEKKLLEIPAGRKEPGEDPTECGRRELTEETGLYADSLASLGAFYPSPGILDEIIHLYLARGLSQGNAAPEFYEEIETVRIPFDEALRMAENDEIRDSKTIVALLRARRLLP
ncbi:MAG: NUDIX hydrolase [Syntrophorhabdaceae bacterium]|nr:NUDIX hydrolase [Syntrophorhabdaceae bacterium]